MVFIKLGKFESYGLYVILEVNLYARSTINKNHLFPPLPDFLPPDFLLPFFPALPPPPAPINLFLIFFLMTSFFLVFIELSRPSLPSFQPFANFLLFAQ